MKSELGGVEEGVARGGNGGETCPCIPSSEFVGFESTPTKPSASTISSSSSLPSNSPLTQALLRLSAFLSVSSAFSFPVPGVPGVAIVLHPPGLMLSGAARPPSLTPTFGGRKPERPAPGVRRKSRFSGEGATKSRAGGGDVARVKAGASAVVAVTSGVGMEVMLSSAEVAGPGVGF